MNLDDTRRESEQNAQRSRDLAQLLDADRRGVQSDELAAAIAEDKRLSAASVDARRRAADRVRAGDDAGVELGPSGPIRRYGGDGVYGGDPDPLRGRLAITSELAAYFVHRRDVLGPAKTDAYGAERRRLELESATLVAAANGHAATLRLRESFRTEGGAELQDALKRWRSYRDAVRDGHVDGGQITNAAVDGLAGLDAARVAAAVEEAGGAGAAASMDQQIAGRVAETVRARQDAFAERRSAASPGRGRGASAATPRMRSAPGADVVTAASGRPDSSRRSARLPGEGRLVTRQSGSIVWP